VRGVRDPRLDEARPPAHLPAGGRELRHVAAHARPARSSTPLRRTVPLASEREYQRRAGQATHTHTEVERGQEPKEGDQEAGAPGRPQAGRKDPRQLKNDAEGQAPGSRHPLSSRKEKAEEEEKEVVHRPFGAGPRGSDDAADRVAWRRLGGPGRPPISAKIQTTGPTREHANQLRRRFGPKR